MPELNKIPLSFSTHGRGFKVAATAIGSGDKIHTSASETAAGKGDDVVLYAMNSHNLDVELVIGFGGINSPDDLIKRTIPAGDYELVLPALLLRNALSIWVAAGTTNVIIIFGYAIRAN